MDTQLFHPQRASEQMRARLRQGHPEDKLLLYVARLSAEVEGNLRRPAGIAQRSWNPLTHGRSTTSEIALAP